MGGDPGGGGMERRASGKRERQANRERPIINIEKDGGIERERACRC